MRHPEFNPTFTDEEIQKAQEICRQRNAPYVQVQRAKLALYLHEHPGSQSSHIATVLGLHEQTVRKWRRRWTKSGFTLEDQPRSGRPRRFSP